MDIDVALLISIFADKEIPVLAGKSLKLTVPEGYTFKMTECVDEDEAVHLKFKVFYQGEPAGFTEHARVHKSQPTAREGTDLAQFFTSRLQMAVRRDVARFHAKRCETTAI